MWNIFLSMSILYRLINIFYINSHACQPPTCDLWEFVWKLVHSKSGWKMQFFGAKIELFDKTICLLNNTHWLLTCKPSCFCPTVAPTCLVSSAHLILEDCFCFLTHFRFCPFFVNFQIRWRESVCDGNYVNDAMLTATSMLVNPVSWTPAPPILC